MALCTQNFSLQFLGRDQETLKRAALRCTILEHTKASARRAQPARRFPAKNRLQVAPPAGGRRVSRRSAPGEPPSTSGRPSLGAEQPAARRAEGPQSLRLARGQRVGGGGSPRAGERCRVEKFLLSPPLACGAVPCVHGFWEVGCSHLPGRGSRLPLPRFSRHLTRRGGSPGRGACRHHPGLRTHCRARRAGKRTPGLPPADRRGAQVATFWSSQLSFRPSAPAHNESASF